MRIGTAAAVAGVIGKRKLICDLWGDTVNIAGRMKSRAVASGIRITKSTRRCLGESFRSEGRGVINVKGEMNTWFQNATSSQNSRWIIPCKYRPPQPGMYEYDDKCTRNPQRQHPDRR